MNKTSLIEELHKQNVFRIGDFTLKSGMQSSIYIDLRVLISSPAILVGVFASAFASEIDSSDSRQRRWLIWWTTRNYSMITSSACRTRHCPLPRSSPCQCQTLPFPSLQLVCDMRSAPMLMRRKEAKAYGTKQLIEGVFESGRRCLVVEDVVTSGASIVETVEVR
jgi:uridine monophosphate synthetase